MIDFGTRCCIVGAGPAGAVLGLLLARQGVDVTSPCWRHTRISSEISAVTRCTRRRSWSWSSWD
ncbi:MAG: FAD-dependent monooxygenase [Chloroflexi bacterium]|nr:FAD-dependent monooxygenase [Chloroflexota bacterium]